MNERTAAALAAALDKVAWDDKGLVPAIAQDAETGRVLTLAWMNREALAATLTDRQATYFSRSRQKLWRKGETSGHFQQVKSVRIDCDSDCVLMQVDQIGGIACHTGRESCFFTEWVDGEWKEIDPVLKSPESIYGK